MWLSKTLGQAAYCVELEDRSLAGEAGEDLLPMSVTQMGALWSHWQAVELQVLHFTSTKLKQGTTS